MPVGIKAAGGKASALILGATTSGNVTITGVNVDPAAPDLAAFLGVLWTGGVDSSAATFAATFGGTSMTPAATIDINSHHDMLKLYTLDDPPTGANKSVVASFSGMGTEATTRNLVVVYGLYSGVDTIGTPVTNSGASTQNNNSTVNSVKAAHRGIFLHAVFGANVFDSYNKITRAHKRTAGIAGGDLLLGDAPGAASITSTAHHLVSTDDWCSIGVPVTPAPVSVDAVLRIAVPKLKANASLLRVAQPPAERFYEIPSRPGELG